MAGEWIKARQTRYGAFIFLYVVVIIAIIIAANWLADRHNKMADVTANKRYTLSDETDKVVHNLKHDVNLYYFDKSDSYDRARDLLDRYRNLSSKIHVEYVDPEKKPDVARVEGAHALGDLIVDNGVKKETAKALTEEELTGALVRASKTGAKTVCFVNGSGEHTLQDTGNEGYSALKDIIEKNNFKTDTISLLEKPDVPKTCSIVVIGGPKRDYAQPTVDALKTYVTGGGSALFNFDPVLNLPDQKMGDTPALAALVSGWGVTPQGDVVLDLSAASRLFGQLAPLVGTYEQHPIVSVMQDNATVFPLARSLEVKAPAEKLFSSVADSFALTNPKLPITEAEIATAKKGPFVLGAASTIGSGSNQGRIVVVGSSNWLSNGVIGAGPVDNRDLALNMMNWLTSDVDLISIRPKNPEDRRLHVTGASMRVLFLTSVIFVPLIVIFSGISVWWKRR